MDAALTDLLTDRCSRYVDRVEASFVPKKDFYYAWSARNGVATVQMSDYLEGAPDEVLADFGEMVVRRALRLKWEEPQSFLDFVRSDYFVVSRRPVFIRRSRNLMRTDRGEHRFLPDSVDRLMYAGLLTADDITNSWFSWTRRDNLRRLGFCGTMFRVVGVSSVLDSPDIPDEMVDFVVYHECLHLRQGYRPSSRVHDSQFRAWERRFPDSRAVEERLRELGGIRRQLF
ncbi:MAG: hypothetical protein Q4Q58_00675 [Thermoplasmata archaeon]|nr:hypothetical protein [Thermoplasmata archaeon]